MNQNGGIHKGGFAVLCHRNGGSESPGILTELYSEWRETGKLNYDDEDSNVWSAITNFSASATARKDRLRRLRSIKNQVPDEDGEREIVELWKESNNWESWDKHLDSLIELLQQE